MNKRWTEHFKADLPTFYDATRKFYAKELKPAEYKGVSGGFGCYGAVFWNERTLYNSVKR